jgi:hypothetical protein
MADAGTRSPEPERRGRRAVRWWLAAAAFVAGVVVGGILVGLVSEGPVAVPDDGTAEPGSAQGPAPATGPTGSPAAGTAEVVVNDSCLRALNAAQDVYGAVNDLGGAASELDLTRLDQVIRQLQPIQQRLQDDIRNCEVVTRLPGGSAVTSRPTVSTGAPPTG